MLQFVLAVDEYRRVNGWKFLSASQIYHVVKKLGYVLIDRMQWD